MADNHHTTFPEVVKGLCQCGCGASVRNRFLPGHNVRLREHPPNWKGGRRINNGYVLIFLPEHPRAATGYVLEHIIIAEKALDKPLPDKAVVHHHNEKRSDNRPQNLIVCENEMYHNLLHVRARALKTCGNPNWRKCSYCKQWDDTINLLTTPWLNSLHYFHRDCKNSYRRTRYRSFKKGN